jgi:predicted XRE-type DNA-binding protein
MPKKQNKSGHITRGNVFDDLGFSPDDAATLKIKATILSALLDRIRQQQYTQTQLAAVLGDYQPNISNLLNGRISKMSIEKLLHYANRLSLDARISVRSRIRSKTGRVA